MAQTTTLEMAAPSGVNSQPLPEPPAQQKHALMVRVRHEVTEDLGFLVGQIPGSFGRCLRTWYYGLQLKRLGPGAKLGTGLEVSSPNHIRIGGQFLTLRNCYLGADEDGAIEIGDHVSFAVNVVVNAGQGGLIRIGHHVGIANNCVLRSSPHRYDDPARPFKSQGHTPGTIIIEDDVWVTANTVLLPGTYVERGCVVCPGSVVSGRVKAYSIIAGNPARVIGRRGERS